MIAAFCLNWLRSGILPRTLVSGFPPSHAIWPSKKRLFFFQSQSSPCRTNQGWIYWIYPSLSAPLSCLLPINPDQLIGISQWLMYKSNLYATLDDDERIWAAQVLPDHETTLHNLWGPSEQADCVGHRQSLGGWGVVWSVMTTQGWDRTFCTANVVQRPAVSWRLASHCSIGDSLRKQWSPSALNAMCLWNLENFQSSEDQPQLYLLLPHP